MSVQNANPNQIHRPDAIADELRWYEGKFPDKAIRSVSKALVGLAEIDGLLEKMEGEIETIEDLEFRETAIRSKRLLQSLSPRLQETFDMRKFESGIDGEEANEQATGSSSPMGIVAYNSKIEAVGHFRVYDLGDQTALVYNIEPRYGSNTFTVKIGGWKGSLGVDIVDDLDSHLETEYYSNNWYRPEMLT